MRGLLKVWLVAVCILTLGSFQAVLADEWEDADAARAVAVGEDDNGGVRAECVAAMAARNAADDAATIQLNEAVEVKWCDCDPWPAQRCPGCCFYDTADTWYDSGYESYTEDLEDGNDDLDLGDYVYLMDPVSAKAQYEAATQHYSDGKTAANAGTFDYEHAESFFIQAKEWWEEYMP